MQLLLNLHVRSKDHATGSDEVRAHLVHVRDTLASQAEAHRAQTGNRHRMAFRCPRLDHLADCVPGRVDSTLGDAAAQGRLLNRRSSERKAMLASALPSRDGGRPKVNSLLCESLLYRSAWSTYAHFSEFLSNDTLRSTALTLIADGRRAD